MSESEEQQRAGVGREEINRMAKILGCPFHEIYLDTCQNTKDVISDLFEEIKRRKTKKNKRADSPFRGTLTHMKAYSLIASTDVFIKT
jgi:hypothetical protein